jgi:hypothetical protein
MKSQKRKTCIFCEGPLNNNNRSNEHVIPVWLLKYLNIEDLDLSPCHYSASNGNIVSKREHTIDELVEGRVCSECNNGWMSILETRSQSLLIELMNSHKSLNDLTNEQHIQIARWACKTAWLLNSSSNFIHNIPLDHYRHIYINEDTLPSKVIVIAQQHSSTSQFYWLQSSTWPVEFGDDLNQADVEKLSKSAYKIGLQLRDLMLLVAFWPHDCWYYSLHMNLHIPLWPLHGRCGWYSGTNWIERKSEEVFFGFFSSLMIITEEQLKLKNSLKKQRLDKSL